MKRIVLIHAFLFIFINISVGQTKKEITLDELFLSGNFYPEYISGVNSMNDGEHFTQLDRGDKGPDVNKYAYASYEKTGTVISSGIVAEGENKGIVINDYSFNADETKMLISTEEEGIYRHSSVAYFYIYDIATKRLTSLADKNKGKQRLAEFSPDGKKVAFVRNNNIFIYDLKSKKETQVTSDGKFNHIINGATDWVYEEEFAIWKGFYWSPDSKNILYYKFDETNVKDYQMPIYGSLYPSHYKFKYPKAGEDNSLLDLFVYNVEGQNHTKLEVHTDEENYFPRIGWTKDANVAYVERLNRLQNKLELLTVDISAEETPAINLVLKEEAETYVDVFDNLRFLKNGKQFVWSSEKDGYHHLYLYNLDGSLKKQLTSGNWEITEMYGIDEENGLVYYQSAESSPTQRDVYSIKLNGKGKKKLSTLTGTNNAMFSKGMKYYVNYHSSANDPYTITLHKSTGEKIKTLEDNTKFKERMKNYDISPVEFFQLTTEQDITLNAWMIKPSNFDKSKKYPVLMYCYNGPGINLVNDSWGWSRYFYHQSIAQKGYIVVCVDGRGTGYRGREFKHCTYKELGKYETIDQIGAAKWLAKQDYVDGSRIGIWGWSYGGYMSSLCITKGADVFKAAIAVAPVTNWRFYDNIYTERFMRTPQENGDNYDVNSPINHVEKLKGKYLLIHGAADDNVHLQNTMEMVTALVQAGKDFDLFLYPNKDHGIRGPKTSLHLYNKMTKFILENL